MDNNSSTKKTIFISITKIYYHSDGNWKDEKWVKDMNLMYKNTID